MSATKLPAEPAYLIRDPDLARAIEALLKPYNGKALERAQGAVRQVRASGVVGTFPEMVEAYRGAITKAVGTKSDD